MGFFDEIGKKISQTASDSAKKTREFVEVTKLNSQITDEKRNITNLFGQIGEKYYLETLANPQPEYAEFFQAIEAANQKIAGLQEEVRKIRNVRACESCGAECTDSVAFCPSCGNALPVAPLEVEEAPALPAANICTNCGETLLQDAAFCTSCGNKVAPVEAENQ